MKIRSPDPQTLRAATEGDLAALDAVLLAVQPGVHHLALRILARPADAADATQEILLKVVTHLGGFRGEAAFSTWVWRIAHNHLLSARTRAAESPEVSLEAIGERLDAGLALADAVARAQGDPVPMTPEDKLLARQVALGCTQSMLMALDREDRLVVVLDLVFDLRSDEAAEVVGVSPAAYRQRLSRARARLDGFVQARCGLVRPDAACHCHRQLPAVRARQGLKAAPGAAAAGIPDLAEAADTLAAIEQVSDAAALFRLHPAVQAPQAQRQAIRAVLTQAGFLQRGQLQ